MSQIMEKTLASLPKLLTQSLIGGGGGAKTQQRQAPAIDVQNFMRHVQRARSKSHEAHIVNSELANIKEKLKQTDLVSSSLVLHSSFTKVLFCHLLGYKVNFAALYAIKLASQGSGYDKRLGYLVSCLLLRPHDEITLLMMCTITKDIKSHNMAESCIGLKVAGELVNENMIPHILPELLPLFGSQHELVREKAIHCFGAFYQRSPELLQPELKRLNLFLTSRDPGVLMAVMNIFVTLTSQNPVQFVGLGLSFLHILDQINNRGFGSSYYYNMIPLPWLQISLLKVLGNIGKEDPELSAKLCPILKSLIEKTKVSVPISLAVLVESIQTATKILPNEALLQLCSRCIMKLLASDSSEDMRYQGLGLLIALSRVKPSYVSQHQVAVIECLTNEDPTIQSRTTLLLHAMANRANIKAISSRLFEQLEKSTEPSFRTDVFMMISDLAERLAPDVDWYLSTNLKILSYDIPEKSKDQIEGQVLRKIEDVSQQDHLVDKTAISNLTETLLSVLEKKNYELAEFSLAIQLLSLLTPIIPEDFTSDRFLNLIAKFLTLPLDNMTNVNNVSIYSPAYFSNKNADDISSNKNMIKLKSLCLMTVKKMALFECVPSASVSQWLDSIKSEITNKNSFLLCDLDELSEMLQKPQDFKMKSSLFCQSLESLDFSLSFLDSLVVEDLLERKECYKPSYSKAQITSQTASNPSPGTTSDYLTEEATSSSKTSEDSTVMDGSNAVWKKKVPSKWRDDDNLEDDFVIEDEKNVSVEGGEKFVIIDSASQLELLKKKKAAEELFAGLSESDFDESTLSLSHSSSNSGPYSTVHVKKGKSIWDDDDDDQDDLDDESRKLGIFDVGKIGFNPFGVSTKKTKAKSKQWGEEIMDDRYEGVGEKGLNNNNQYANFVYASTSDDLQSSGFGFTESLLSQEGDAPWSNHTEMLSTAPEVIHPTSSIYATELKTDSVSNSPVTSLDNMSGSTMDALTDSDPEANER